MILCVEDDSNIRDLIVYTLNTTGMEAKGTEDGKGFFKMLENEIPDLVLLDLMLPGEDGLSILRKKKANSKTKDIPVIVISAKGAEYDKVLGLDEGADDYVTKPFGMMELVARVKAVLRRTKRLTGLEELTYENLRMDLKRHEIYANGTYIGLTLKEFELLRKLMENKETVLTRDQLLEEIWGYDFDGETRTVDVHVRTLRQKLGDVGELIKTVRGVGYMIGVSNES